MRSQQSQNMKLMEAFQTMPIQRAHELKRLGVSPGTLARKVEQGVIDRISRGLYQLAGASIETGQNLAEAHKRVPKGVIALVSALAFHDLTDQLPRFVWMAIGISDWSPVPSYPPIKIVRFSDRYLKQSIELHQIAGVSVPIYSIEKSLADAFRNPKLVDRSVAIEALRSALSRKNIQPSILAEASKAGGAWNVMRPYLEALTSNG